MREVAQWRWGTEPLDSVWEHEKFAYELHSLFLYGILHVLDGVLVYSIMKALLMSQRELGSSNGFYREQAFEALAAYVPNTMMVQVAMAFIASRRLKPNQTWSHLGAAGK